MKKAILAIILLCYGYSVMSQCEFDINAPIVSQELGQYEIVVSDLEQSDLGSDQALCGVRLHFEHTSLTNLRISLISPDGDRVYLVGPASVAPTITDFTDWDVEFVPCSSPAAPDTDIPDQWSNTSNWNSIETYEGSYYPSGGCLEDFDSGSANGIWTIEVEDLGNLNEGTLNSIELIFCNDTGLACQICDAQVLGFNSDQQLYCEGDNSIILADQLIQQSSGPNLAPILVLVQNGQILEITQDNLQVESLAPGTYQIFGGVILDGNDYSSFTNIQDLESVLIGGTECGDLSTDAIDLVILEVLSTQVIMESICRDEPFVWNDMIFTAPLDTVLYTFDQASEACSSSTEITLTLQESGLEISESFEVVECGEEIVLSATEIDANIDYLWTTLNGSIVNGSNTPFVVVNSPGTYYLYGAEDCIPSDSIELSPAGNFGQVSLLIDSEDCSNNLSTLSIDSDLTISSFYWLGPDIEGSTVMNPSISQSGDYGVVVFSDDFICDSIIVYQSFSTVDNTVLSVIKTNDLDCFDRSAELFVDIGDALLLDSRWYSPNGNLQGTGLSTIATQSGEHTVEVAYLNGCTETLTVDVDDSRQIYDLSIDLILLDCSTQEGLATVNTNGPIESVIWTGPFGYYSEDVAALLNSYGTYRALVIYADGCRQVKFFEADYNESTSPVVELDHDPIDCNNDCGVLYVASGHDPSYQYNWAGPSGFQSSLLNPKVFNPGNYFVTVTDSDGCESIYFEYVNSNTNGIEFSILAEILTCVNTSTDLSASTNFSELETFTWSGPDIDASNENEEIPVVTLPGMYTLSGVGANGCEFEQSVEVMINNTPPTVTNDQETFNIACQGSTTLIEVVADMPIASYVWSVPFEFGPTLTISEAGQYSVTVTNENFCTAVAEYTVTQVDMIELSQLINEVALTCAQPTLTIPIIATSLDPTLIANIQSIDAVSTNGVSVVGTQSTPSEGGITFEKEGNYTLVVTFENGCVLTEIVDVTESFDPIVPEFSIPVFDCNSPDGIDVTLLNASQYSEIEWNDTDVILGSDPTYVYTDNNVALHINLIDINGCVTDMDVEVTVDLALPDFDLSYEESGDCDDPTGILTANISTDVIYDWSTLDGQILTVASEQMIQVEGSGTYSCTVTNLGNGCSHTETVEVVADAGLGDIELELVQPSCDNNALVIVDVTLDSQTAITESYIIYMNGFVIDNFPVFIMEEGEHTITVENLDGCKKHVTVEAELIPTFDIDIDPKYTIAEGESIDVILEVDSQMDVSDFEIQWSGDAESVQDLNATYSPLETTEYTVIVTDSFGCTQMLDFTIEVIVSTAIFVPNIFKVGDPGPDGSLTIVAPKSTTMEMEVYDRWGNIVFQMDTDEPQISWDGTVANQLIEQGVYIINLQVTFNGTEPVRQISDITIIR